MSVKRLALAGVVVLAAVLLAGAATLVYARGSAAPLPPGRQTVAAPIEKIDVVVRESNPPQVTLKVTAGLPGGCAQKDSYSVKRVGDAITVTVLNSTPTGNSVCTMIYGFYDLAIDLGSGFTPGTTYSVQVNDKTTTFKV